MWQLLLTLVVTVLMVKSYEPIVNELEQYVSSNATFASELNETFIEANFSNTTFNDMYLMFNLWLTNVPTMNIDNNCNVYTLTDIINPFATTTTGEAILKYTTTSQWFASYLNDWKSYLDSNDSAYIVDDWMKCINMSEYIIPSNGYSSFNDFFTRHINLTYRPITNISDNSVIVSPADSLIRSIERNINLSKQYNVKGENYNITQMLNNSKYVERFEGGDIIQTVLLFNNYHRYHSPISGVVQQIDLLGGWYFVEDSNVIDFSEENNNRRGVVYTTDNNNNNDKIIAAVHVGFNEVSSVNFIISQKSQVIKGDEVGHFAFGGSSVILIFEPGYIDKFSVRIGEKINMGQQIAISTNR